MAVEWKERNMRAMLNLKMEETPSGSGVQKVVLESRVSEQKGISVKMKRDGVQDSE